MIPITRPQRRSSSILVVAEAEEVVVAVMVKDLILWDLKGSRGIGRHRPITVTAITTTIITILNIINNFSNSNNNNSSSNREEVNTGMMTMTCGWSGMATSRARLLRRRIIGHWAVPVVVV